MVIVWVRVEGSFLDYRAVVCPCLCRLVGSSSCVFTVIGYDSCVRGMKRFRWYFRSVESVGRSWRSLMIFERVSGVEVGRSRCRDRRWLVKIGDDRSIAGGFRRLDLMLRSSSKRSRSRILVS